MIVTSCFKRKDKNNDYEIVIDEQYELYKPLNTPKGVLILFGGFPEKAKDIKVEFDIIDIAIKNRIAVMFTNFNQMLWLEDKEKKQIGDFIETAIISNNLPNENIYFGGFSSGGNVALSITEFLINQPNLKIKPKGVFIIDSPLDLQALYNTSLNNIKMNVSKISVRESNWIIQILESRFDKPSINISNYQQYSIFNHQTNYTKHFDSLKNIKLRFYTEPDLQWWLKNRNTEYRELNAFYIKELSQELIHKGYNNLEYIETSNQGYRANGERHPHSWSIVNKKDLLNWILEY
ncbi:hypothetical protein [Flammeovirga pectinis]|uniref:hypothetical protein n=1 Tax=Flammeovirga pectinis TaxID=2494373 RepID=UPI00197A794E|nr:hypothetical protein [Flammeovirga pectinis]